MLSVLESYVSVKLTIVTVAEKRPPADKSVLVLRGGCKPTTLQRKKSTDEWYADDDWQHPIGLNFMGAIRETDRWIDLEDLQVLNGSTTDSSGSV